MAILTLSVLAMALIGLNEYARAQQHEEMKKRIELEKKEPERYRETDLKGMCDECSYHKTLNYSEKEKLWLCRGCE